MYEEFLVFKVVPTPGERVCGFKYSYRYGEDEMFSAEAEYNFVKESLRIKNLLKSAAFLGRQDKLKFEHLGTRMMVEMLTDMHYRQGHGIKSISGWLAYSDRESGKWETSIPFYAGLPKYAKAKGCLLNFHLFDENKQEIWNSGSKSGIRDCMDAFIAQNKDLYFRYDVAWELGYTGQTKEYEYIKPGVFKNILK